MTGEFEGQKAKALTRGAKSAAISHQPSEGNQLAKLPCPIVQSLLPFVVQGRLADSLRLAVEEHLALCPTCQAEYAELSALQDDLGWVMEVVPPAPEGLWGKIEAAISSEASEPASPYRLLESCLHLLVSLGIPEWSVAPVTQTVAMAKEIRQGRLPALIDSLIGHLATD